MTSRVIYEGDLHTTATHLQSGTVIETDAPVDNGGRGERFSPTDLVATALATCMCTIMGLAAKARRIQLGRIECDVEKIMAANPRRISEVKVNVTMPGPETYTSEEIAILEHAAITCPVYLSLHQDCIKTVLFSWPGSDNT